MVIAVNYRLSWEAKFPALVQDVKAAVRWIRANSPESLLLGQKITEIPERVKAANPETYVRPGAPPFYLQHGTKDCVVPVQQSINFAAKLSAMLGEDRVKLELIQEAEHADPRFESLENVGKDLDFMDKCLKYP